MSRASSRARGATDGSPAAPPVRVRDLAVAIAGRPVLRGIDLEVARGELLALMGANGSGKSTLVRTVLGLRPATGGSVEVWGTPLARFHDWRRIGFVPQRAGAASGVPASVWEVVASGRLTHRRLLRPLGAADRAAIAHALEVVGLADRARDGVADLSGGQQQRVLIARALAGEPDLLFLDEPTAGVDLHHQRGLADALARAKDGGATIVLVAHELGPLAPLVDRAVVMRDGRVAYDGAPLADHGLHDPAYGEAHVHHHAHHDPAAGGPHDPHHPHAPHRPAVSSPLDPRRERR